MTTDGMTYLIMWLKYILLEKHRSQQTGQLHRLRRLTGLYFTVLSIEPSLQTHHVYFTLKRTFKPRTGYGSTMSCCEYYTLCLCQVPSSRYLKISYFTSKDENSSADQLERKRYDINVLREKMI